MSTQPENVSRIWDEPMAHFLNLLTFDESMGLDELEQVHANPATIQTFSETLEALAAKEAYNDLREDDGPEVDPLAEAFPRDSKAESKTEALYEQGTGVFACINVVKKGMPRRNENIVRVLAVYVDLDKLEDDPWAKLLASPIKPSFVVESSPGKFHAYWLVVKDFPLKEFWRMQKLLIAHFKSDPAVCDLARVMRVPSSKYAHRKNGGYFLPHLCPHPDGGHVCWVDSCRRLTLKQLLGAFDPSVRQSGKRRTFQLPEYIEESNPGRNKTLFDYARSLRRQGEEAMDITEKLLAANTERCEPALSDSEVRGIATRAVEHVDNREDDPDDQQLALPIIRCMADVQPEQVTWLWKERIALGKLSLIAGNPGLGKSLITTAMAACVSVGGTWPDQSPCPDGHVLILSAEDDPGDTIRPRLDAAQADVSKVHIMQSVHDPEACTERLVDLDRDIEALHQALEKLPGTKLVIIDPISAYMGATDSHNNSEVRNLLAKLAELAAAYSCALVVVSHLNKSSGTAAAYRITGSLAFTAAARAVYGIVSDEEDPAKRFLVPIKNNLGIDRTGFSYTIEGGPDRAPVIQWSGEPVTAAIDELLDKSSTGGKGKSRRSAARWLVDLLRGGPVLVTEIQEQAQAEGHAWKTVQRAKNEEFIKHERAGFQGPVQWCLMSDEEKLARLHEQNKNAPLATGEVAEAAPDY